MQQSRTPLVSTCMAWYAPSSLRAVNSIAWAPHETDQLILACAAADGTVAIVTFDSTSLHGLGL
jgi:hypothetical protein